MNSESKRGIKIELADASHLTAFKSYVDECVTDGIVLYEFIFNNHATYLNKRIAYARGEQLPKGWTPISTYFCIENDIILGSLRVRQGDSDYINNVIGHVGYETRPSARGQGVAQLMLSYIQNTVLTDAVIITCAPSNLASRKVIEKCGGEFLNQFYSKEEALQVLRYRLSPA
ncbi:GNAT family N-acetyltransferase [Moritella marina ATCC 15381]|uniref:GNAT family N-acetyltransferase n=1 Tax=Moritella marina ATCC 15381 TaxID=1202962 RepID=A0A5J6WFK7_MORMI|nr:GNAT family N-acetyltransferase [Moritella marina]QFI36717.1 GNAT family N-acetyltransferase [Moritella marina ATCC 15381]